jgi:hypothetical protein
MADVKLCECGCGELAPIAKHDHRRSGHVRGQPVRFVHGHRARLDARPLAERFAEKVTPATDLSPNGMAGCIVWTGSTNGKKGYGNLRNPGASRYTHIIAWHLADREPIPVGYELDHLCRRTLCVNVDHLEPVTSAENTRRGVRTRLTHEQAREIRYLAGAGWQPRDIAEAYGVSREHVYSIRDGRAWANV